MRVCICLYACMCVYTYIWKIQGLLQHKFILLQYRGLPGLQVVSDTGETRKEFSPRTSRRITALWMPALQQHKIHLQDFDLQNHRIRNACSFQTLCTDLLEQQQKIIQNMKMKLTLLNKREKLERKWILDDIVISHFV